MDTYIDEYTHNYTAIYFAIANLQEKKKIEVKATTDHCTNFPKNLFGAIEFEKISCKTVMSFMFFVILL